MTSPTEQEPAGPDIVERLRAVDPIMAHAPLCYRAANEIKQLRLQKAGIEAVDDYERGYADAFNKQAEVIAALQEEIEQLCAALRPFAEWHRACKAANMVTVAIEVEDLARAAELVPPENT